MGRWILAALVILPAWAQMAQASDSVDVLKARLAGRSAGAHQGGLYGLKFNTMKAFKKAVARGVDVIEMDLRMSKDGVPMVFHDAKLNTWTYCRGPVHDKTVEELKRCHFKLNFQKIPTYEEVLAWAQGRVVVDAEFKDVEDIAPAIALVQKYKAHAWTYFQARDWNKYTIARSLDPDVVLLVDPRDAEDVRNYLAVDDPAMLIFEVGKNGTNTPELINLIHAAGKLVTEDAWDYSKTFEFFRASCGKAFDHGVDIAISNRPGSCVRQK